MGKTRGKGKKGKGGTAKPKAAMGANASDKTHPKYTAGQLIERAQGYIDTFEYQMAQKFCQRALEMEPDNVEALETSGSLLLELGDMENAKCCFGRAIELQPDVGHSKYMYMGQLMTGELALQCFQKGIEIMSKMLEESSLMGACAEPEITPQDLSNAYCSMAEIYLTDKCMSEDAEAQCESCLHKAVEADSENPEAYHLFGSFWISKEDKQKAKEMLEKGLSLWLPQLKEVTDKPETDANVDLVDVCPVSYPGRVNVTKMLIELEEYEKATEILELLLDEEDQVVEVWYQLGWANHLQGEDYAATARYYLKKGLKVAEKTKCEDKEMVSHIEKLLEELGPGDEGEGEEDAEDGVDLISDSEDEETTTQHEEEQMEH